jgi:hypothetical protein
MPDMRANDDHQPMPKSHLVRLAWLLACLACGGLVGGLGRHLTGEDVWFLAIPAAVALGWLFFANPGECLGPGSGQDPRPERRRPR